MNIFYLLGFAFLLIAFAGAVLPLLPTTPFLLLSAGCFARSSPRWHAWLVNNSTFGPAITNWENNRCVECSTKYFALASMAVMGSLSMIFAMESTQMRVITALLMLIGAVVVCSIKTCDKCRFH